MNKRNESRKISFNFFVDGKVCNKQAAGVGVCLFFPFLLVRSLLSYFYDPVVSLESVNLNQAVESNCSCFLTIKSKISEAAFKR